MIISLSMDSFNSRIKRNRLPLFALRAFEVAGRHESFQKAADELSVTASAVSRQIAELERFLGGKLFVRNVRRITLTVEGKALLNTLTLSMDEMACALQEVRTRILA